MIDAWGRVPTFAVSSAVAALGHAVIAAILAHEYNNGIGMSLASVVCLNAAIAIAYVRMWLLHLHGRACMHRQGPC